MGAGIPAERFVRGSAGPGALGRSSAGDMATGLKAVEEETESPTRMRRLAGRMNLPPRVPVIDGVLYGVSSPALAAFEEDGKRTVRPGRVAAG